MASDNHLTVAEWLWAGLLVTTPYLYSAGIYDGALLPRLLLVQVGLCAIAAIPLFSGRSFSHPARTLMLPGLALIGWTALTVFTARSPIQATLDFSRSATLIAVPLVAAVTIRRGSLVTLTRIGVWSAAPLAFIGCTQFLGLGFYAIPSNAQPSATFFHRNAAAEYLIVILPLAVWCVAVSRSKVETFAHAAAATLLGVFLIFTRARGAWVGLVVAASVALLVQRHVTANPRGRLAATTRVALTLGAAIILLSALVPDRILKHGSQPFDEKKSDAVTAVTSIFLPGGHRGRPTLWKHTLQMIWDHPFVGVGPGHWVFAYPDYARGEHMNASAAPRRPHNDPLWIAAESGLPALVAYATLVIFALLQALRLARSSSDQRGLALAFATVILAHIGESLFNFPRERVAPSLLFGFALAAPHILAARMPKPAAGIARRLSLVAAGALLLAAAVTVRRIQYDAHHLQVHIAERAEDWPSVIDHGEAARRIGPMRENTFIALGRAYFRQGRFSDAIAEHRRALSFHPNSVNALNNLGIALRKDGKLAEAEQALDRAVELYPPFPEAHYNLGNVILDQDRPEEALAHYRIAAAARPDARIFFNQARAFARLGDPVNTRNALVRALSVDPDFEPAVSALGAMGADTRALHDRKPREHDE